MDIVIDTSSNLNKRNLFFKIKNTKIRTRILGLFLAIIMASIAIVAGTTYFIGKNSLENITKNQLNNSVRFVIDQISLLSGAYNSKEFSGKLGYVITAEHASFKEAGLDTVIYLIKSNGDSVNLDNVNSETSLKTDLPDYFIKEAFSKKRDNVDMVINGVPKSLSYGYVIEKDWIYVVAVTKSSYMKVIYKLQFVTLLSGILSVFLAFVASIIGTRGIINTIMGMNKTVSSADTGNLTVRTKSGHGGPELRGLANNFNKMLSNFEATIKEIGYSIEELLAASRDLSQISQKTDDSATYTNTITQKMAEDTLLQENSLLKIKHTTDNIIEIIHGIVYQVADAAKTSEIMMTTVHDGLRAINELESKIASVEEVSQNTLYHIKILETRSDEINKITNTIKAISAQTKLLSFNASIEAARAGEFGAGFNVVANEIQKLAQISAQSAFEVSEIIKEIHNDTEEVLRSANLGMAISHQSTELAAKTDDSFKSILERVSETHNHINLISKNTSSISENIKLFVNGIDKMSDMVMDTTRNCQEVAATVEDHKNLSSEIILSAKNLQNMASKLNELKATYKTD